MERSKWAIAGFVMGILSFFSIFGIEKAIAAIVFGILGLREIKRNKKLSGKWLSIASVILGIAAIILIAYTVVVILPQYFSMLSISS
ncbi:MAG: DUF4190 domain-containing protein [Candidatus Aenigmatarchaeota archaeon]